VSRSRQFNRNYVRSLVRVAVQGVHIFHPPPLNSIQYLPSSSLSPDPATRFSELFSLKPRWPEAEMGLFIDDLTAGDKKKRDALVLKFVRKVKEKDETWWTPRNLWS
jgi:sister chromatid cohesion protein DCC1